MLLRLHLAARRVEGHDGAVEGIERRVGALDLRFSEWRQHKLFRPKPMTRCCELVVQMPDEHASRIKRGHVNAGVGELRALICCASEQLHDCI